ncbi:MAG: MBL fold metallo-hydrolase [Bacteroidales bacterium]|nr:MBL fold metallo-hydrolase [Bacteroidales bacterium]
MKVKFISLSSGSSGNCYYLEAERKAILIDAGIPVRTIQKTLHENGLSFDKVMGLFITHDHTDHIKSAGSIGELYHIPVYATKAVHGGMERNYGMSKKLSNASRRFIETDIEIQVPGTIFRVTPFMVPHDSTDNVGYYIEIGYDGEEPVKFCLVTDCGRVTTDIKTYLGKANHVVVESNHDVEMLMKGPYPQYLKNRVRGEGGHLSNDECAELIKTIYHDTLKHIFLCHLSHENNTPDIAYRAAENALREKGAEVGIEGTVLSVLMRNRPSLVYVFETGLPTPQARQLTLGF